jgi:NAD(P)-dependent dehydrogenase (short-subunit alcohol dehydrogenase family)
MSQPSFRKSFTKIYRTGPYSTISPTRPEISAKGKTIIVTAGHTGIGYAIASNFATAGASHVILIGRREAVLINAAEELSFKNQSTNFHFFAVSIADEDLIENMFASVRRDIAEPDILVTSAAYFADGTGIAGNVATTPLKEMRASFETNVIGNLILVQAFLSSGTKSCGEKTILDVSSCAAHMFMPKVAGAYSASKLAFTKLLAVAQVEARMTGNSLRVNSFHPGAVFTQAVADFGNTADQFPWDDVELPGQFAVWLASPQAKFLNGRFVWANWDAEELMMREEEIVAQDLLKLGIVAEAEWDTKIFG